MFYVREKLRISFFVNVWSLSSNVMYYYAVSKLKLESMKKIVKLEVRRNTIASIRNSMRTEFGSRISRKWLTNRWTSIWNSKGGVKLFSHLLYASFTSFNYYSITTIFWYIHSMNIFLAQKEK
jgi:hypothetical protein